MAAASAANVDILVFPELSLSGYELPALGQYTVQPQDELLEPIRQLVQAHAITVVLASAAPLPYIGAIALLMTIYLRRYCNAWPPAARN
ncbi:hypothetical protein [Pseudomonas sp.]|uniref:hypothetical protein n=1 Tax=Pseudomonas sp. TaxID=306 RepID=UPI003523D75E